MTPASKKDILNNKYFKLTGKVCLSGFKKKGLIFRVPRFKKDYTEVTYNNGFWTVYEEELKNL